MMSDILSMTLAFTAGAALSVFFFSGLHWTIHRSETSNYPALLFLTSALVRTGVTLAGVWFATYGQLLNIIICMAAFILMRFVIIKWYSIKDGVSKTIKHGTNVT